MMTLIGNTPIQVINLQLGLRSIPLHLKLEGCNPGGSVKDRTAIALIRDLQERGLLKQNSTIIESTSGNLGVALAYISESLGYRFVAVVDPKITPENSAKMQNAGAVLDKVTELDETGGFLLTRLRRVQHLLSSIKGAVWPNQYENPANVRAHLEGTGAEILHQMDSKIDVIFLAVSTGGTLAGVSRCLRKASPSVRVIAVDAKGSIALGGIPGSRLLTGIGASRAITLANRNDYDSVIYIDDANAFACCRALHHRTNLDVGGSSGAVIAAATQWLSEQSDPIRVVCLCPDTGANYRSSIFNDDYVTAALPSALCLEEYYQNIFANNGSEMSQPRHAEIGGRSASPV